jgi:NADH:ubiquinone oxidoreductase subunit F (NADH-binding)/NADH:ubiquinone oxidoreductase subunit E
VQPSYSGSSSAAPDASAPAFGEKARAVEEVIARHRNQNGALVTLLVELTRALGPLSPTALDYVALKLRLPATAIKATAGAHRLTQAEQEPPPLGLCVNGACAARGGNEVERILREKGIAFETLRCQGACDLGPIACYGRGAPLAISAARARSLAKADPSDWEDLLSVEKPVHAFRTEPRVVFANLFAKGSHLLATARRHGVWAPAERALERPGEDLIGPVEDARLQDASGRGVAERWRAARAAGPGPKVLVVNAVEAEPGSFQDRVLLERDPHLVLSGAILAAHGIGAGEVFVCVRAEYELAAERIRAAVDEAQRAGLFGERASGPAASVDVGVRLAPGLLTTAEPTALLESLEGRPPRPRLSGPPIELSGLFGRPTVVHGPETLAALPAIAERGGAYFRELGLGGAAGTKVVSLSGDVKRPGNYEVPRGTPLSTLVDELGGGLAQGKRICALQVGGGFAPFLPPSALGVGLSDDALSPFGARVGSGALVVITEKSCLFDLARRDAELFAREGCGCPGCNLAPRWLSQVERLPSDPEAEVELVALSRALAGPESCPIARNASAALLSLFAQFRSAIAEHGEGACPCSPRKRARPG